jgi:Tol biopolymer transport system component
VIARLRPALSGIWDDELILPVAPTGRYDQTGDGAHIYWGEDLAGGQTRFFWDGKPGDPFELIRQDNGELFAWSTDMFHLAYYGKRGGSFFVGIDGAESPPYEGITRSVPPTFSPDGAHLAYGVSIDGQWRLIFDGAPLGNWRPAPRRPVFSPDSSRFAFVAENRELNARPHDYHQRVILDGTPQPEADGISADPLGVQFSPDSRRFAYLRVDGKTIRLVVDDTDWPSFPEINHPTFSPDSRRMVYAAGDRGRMAMVGEGLVGGPTYYRLGPPVFSPDGLRLGYLAFRGKGRMVGVVDGTEGPEYADAWGNVEFSPDSRRVAYLAQRRGGGLFSRRGSWGLVIDGAIQGEWDEVGSNPHFSPDASRVAFTARHGKAWSVVVDDVPGSAYVRVGPPAFSSAGRLGYLAMSGSDRKARESFQIVVDGIETPSMEEPTTVTGNDTFTFSPDGQHVATVGKMGGIWRPIVDAAVGPGSEGVGRIRFDDDVVSFIAAADDGIHRLAVRVQS